MNSLKTNQDAPWEIKVDRCLILSDIHHDIEWAQAVLDHEKGHYDKVILNGDFFDTHKSFTEVAGAKQTALWLKNKLDDNEKTFHIHIGNHDSPVYESWPYNARFTNKHYILHECSGFSHSRAMEVNKVLSWEDIQKVRVFHQVNGWLVSHAGFHPHYWNGKTSIEHNLARIWTDSLQAINHFGQSWVFACGHARGGYSPIGGPLWLDFHTEFIDTLPVPQCMGHTMGIQVRRIGRSYCIDTGQKSYSFINRDGSIEFKTLKAKHIKGIASEIPNWVEEDTSIMDLTDLVAKSRDTSSTLFSVPDDTSDL